LGAGQERVIESNTGTMLTLETAWTTLPDSTSGYAVAGINAYWRSKDYDFGGHDIVKLFRHLRARLREEGNFNLTLHYIVDFRDVENATSQNISLLESGMAWDYSYWDQSRWDGRQNIRKKISLRNTTQQRLNGTHLALRFSNARANESFRITGFDIELKAIGKR
jgi:hypothetical protein